MTQKLYDIKNEFHRFGGDRCGNGGTGLVVYYPTEQTDFSEIAILTMHGADYMGFYPMVELAKRGFVAAGVAPGRRDVKGWLAECKCCVDFLKSMPGVKKVVLMGHSQGGCMMSCYQYIAENGTARFANTDRIIPFPQIEPLTPVEGLMLLDANYGIMQVLALDPGVRSLRSGYARIPQLDIYNPDNGYVPNGSRYHKEFIRRFQRAQIKQYNDLLDMAMDRMAKINAGRGDFEDDEPVLIAGAAGGSSNNKLFCQDISLLGRTSVPQPLLHADGSLTIEIVHTTRPPEDAVPSSRYHRGASLTTVRTLLEQQLRFDEDFGYDECNMWGLDDNFNYLSTRANVKGITVPLLCQGNSASHEFVNTEFNFVAAASADKEIFITEGSCHDYYPVDKKYGDTLTITCNYIADWLAKPGRFL